MIHVHWVIFDKRKYAITYISITTPLSTLLADRSGFVNLLLSHTSFGNAVMPPVHSFWKEERVREGVIAPMM
jgi:hypothetical protein